MKRSSINLALAAGMLAATAFPSDVVSEPSRKSERERAAAAERGRQSRERSRAAHAKSPFDLERIRLAAERRARKVARQAKGFAALPTKDGEA